MKINVQKWFYVVWTILLLFLGRKEYGWFEVTAIFIIAGGFIMIVDSLRDSKKS